MMETFALFAISEKLKTKTVHGLESNGTIQKEGNIMAHMVEKNTSSVSGLNACRSMGDDFPARL